MSTKTDLAKEIIDRISPDYPKKKEKFFGKTKITEIAVETPEEADLLEKPKGRYITIEADSIRPPFDTFDEEAAAIAAELGRLLPKKDKILVVGIGNEGLTADSLGPLTAKKLPCGKFSGRELFAFSPGVSGATGIEPVLLIKSAAEKLEPDGIIIIDSLLAENIFHICRTIQLTDSGIAPGSGISGKRKALNRESIGFPVIAAGTPTVTLSAESDSLFVSPGDIDFLVKRAARLLAVSLVLAVFPEIGIETAKEWVI
ncbi:MAG: GPR endopeptidase [Oscillospiraceae bacterium]|nr:GPR endopeptidase [Oscillospiraceae bacterium]